MNFSEFLDKFDTVNDQPLIESIKEAYALMEMKDPMDWSKGQQPGQRVGKSDRNIEKTREKSANPVTVRFHRTPAVNSDSIKTNGLLLKNDNYGGHTGDSSDYQHVIWTADNPDEIPVLRSVSEFPRYSKDIDTFKITMPKDEYKKSSRMKFSNGRRSGDLRPADEDDDTVANEGSYKIDVFNQDISPDHLKLMDKNITPEQAAEAQRFRAWKYGCAGNTEAGAWDGIRKSVPARLNDGGEHSRYYWDNPRHMEKDVREMDEMADYISPIENEFDWDLYNHFIRNGYTPRDAARQSLGVGRSNRPWNDVYHLRTKFNTGHVGNATDMRGEMENNKKLSSKQRKENLLNDRFGYIGTLVDIFKQDLLERHNFRTYLFLWYKRYCDRDADTLRILLNPTSMREFLDDMPNHWTTQMAEAVSDCVDETIDEFLDKHSYSDRTKEVLRKIFSRYKNPANMTELFFNQD